MKKLFQVLVSDALVYQDSAKLNLQLPRKLFPVLKYLSKIYSQKQHRDNLCCRKINEECEQLILCFLYLGRIGFKNGKGLYVWSLLHCYLCGLLMTLNLHTEIGDSPYSKIHKTSEKNFFALWNERCKTCSKSNMNFITRVQTLVTVQIMYISM